MAFLSRLNFTAPAPTTSERNPRSVFVVYEPPNRDGAVPYMLQQMVQFSHAKLVVLNSSKTDLDANSKGKVYDFWKEGKSSLGDACETFSGLKPGETYTYSTTTRLRDADIAQVGKF
jgi:hypothetical protein